MPYPKVLEKVEKEVDLTAINEDSTQTIGESPKNILPPPEAAVPSLSESSSKTNNQESVKGAKATIDFLFLTDKNICKSHNAIHSLFFFCLSLKNHFPNKGSYAEENHKLYKGASIKAYLLIEGLSPN